MLCTIKIFKCIFIAMWLRGALEALLLATLALLKVSVGARDLPNVIFVLGDDIDGEM